MSSSTLKRKVNSNDTDSDLLVIQPFGAGQEVGRSCILLDFKGKRILLDFGIHPGLSGTDALPMIDSVDLETIDILLISHFHLDHCGALPWFLEKAGFKGRCFMTHPTKAIYKLLLSDYIKVSNIGADEMLYSEKDLENSMAKIETIDFHQEIEVNGVKFWCYHAGHVLGAAMFMIEIAGVRVLYTGDFSRDEDRHLMAAELPSIKPDVLIIEATYGVNLHEPREEREKRFTESVRDIVKGGGKCLIPVFALGRAQELLLILDEYWSNHPELHGIPIYYASSLAKKCMAVYQTFVNAMNDKIRKQIGINNPFIFKHISNLKTMDEFDDMGPCVVLASPGMMQSGLSRELFESWCTDKKSGVIIAGYCVEGTLAKRLLNESPNEMTTMSGDKIPIKCSVKYISFSAHTDFKQTTQFIRALKPPHIILVHGEKTEMQKLKTGLQLQYEDNVDYNIQVYNPKNTQSVELYFRGEKTAKIVGKLATMVKAEENARISGVLVKRNFKYQIMLPEDLPKYTDLAVSTVLQRQSVPYSGSSQELLTNLYRICGNLEQIKEQKSERVGVKIYEEIDLYFEKGYVILEWDSGPLNDMYADGVLAIILKLERDSLPADAEDDLSKVIPKTPPRSLKDLSLIMPERYDRVHFENCLFQTYKDMFGTEFVEYRKGDRIIIKVYENTVIVNLKTMTIETTDDDKLQHMVGTVIEQCTHLLNVSMENLSIKID